MIIETKNGRAFASSEGLLMTQVAELPDSERRYVKERTRTTSLTTEEDLGAWREANIEEFKEFNARVEAEMKAEMGENIG